ncbi:transducin beta-like protein 2 isoform X2 [Spodoptera frugiperda]|uniref:Transducin beta-like protein 2 isoform X2 n=2 Tax=Spodoptera frugiperda TaxID=7108 RepID=A0A9R0D4R2_SPOFR|nr:transducin beta-like protein 2 isoform X2 [Spodoptera frugiperda]
MGGNLAGQNVNVFLLGGITIFFCVILHFVYKIVFKSKKKEALQDENESNSGAPAEEVSSEPATTETRVSGKSKKRATWKGKTEFSHPWLLKNLKGHPGTVLLVDFSANGKFMAATCDDGSVILWDIRDLNQKEHKTLRVNIEFDYASHVAWSPDSKAFIVHTVRDNHIIVYKIEKKKDGTIGSATPVITFDKVHETDAVGFDISSNGKFMMSCSSNNDMVIWDLKGQQLERLDTYLMTTHTAKVSPCGRFVVATGFAPDVKVMEVCFTKTGEFKQVTKAFELTGHSSGVYDVAFDVDTSHIATISKDGTWKLYHTKIEYTRGESPHVLETGTYRQTANPPHIALSPNAEVLAVSVDSSVEFYDTYTGKLYDTVENVYSGLINYMKFDASGKYLFVCGDRAVRILHNVCGYQTTIASCIRLQGTKQTSATIERQKKTIEECKQALAKFGK